ncbi:MAG: hypothetical protein JNN15_14135, partial [Blastocatellia bacterium]|nr:hypothetical protein [Blastocatellia bacterium]
MSSNRQLSDKDKELLSKFSAAASTVSQKATNSTTAPDLQPEDSRNYKAGNIPERTCYAHPELEGIYYCQICNIWRCRDCANDYGGVYVCSQCDTIAVHYRKLNEVVVLSKEASKPFQTQILDALTFPFRHYIITLITFLATWLGAGIGDSASDLINSPPILNILFGQSVGVTGTIIGLLFLGWISAACMVARSDGHEGWDTEKITDYSVVTEPLSFWAVAALVALLPFGFYVGYKQFQSVIITIFFGYDPTLKNYTGFTIWNYVVALLLAVWGLFSYTMIHIVTAVRRSALAGLNPLAWIGALVGLRQWLVPILS